MIKKNVGVYTPIYKSILIYLRCKDHQPSDGLGAHRLILAAASSRLKEILLEVSSAEDELICLHLPDYTSVEVGPVMSLLYYGETWITESCAQVCQDILQVSNFIYICPNSQNNNFIFDRKIQKITICIMLVFH